MIAIAAMVKLGSAASFYIALFSVRSFVQRKKF